MEPAAARKGICARVDPPARRSRRGLVHHCIVRTLFLVHGKGISSSLLHPVLISHPFTQEIRTMHVSIIEDTIFDTYSPSITIFSFSLLVLGSIAITSDAAS